MKNKPIKIIKRKDAEAAAVIAAARIKIPFSGRKAQDGSLRRNLSSTVALWILERKNNRTIEEDAAIRMLDGSVQFEILETA